MKRCTSCGDDFSTTAEEDFLIGRGELPCICMNCLRSQCYEQLPSKKGADRPVPKTAMVRRVDWLNPDGTTNVFISVPPVPPAIVAAPLRKPKKWDVHVSIMSLGASDITTTPPIRIISNFHSFKDQQAFWAKKSVTYADPATGVQKILIPTKEITSVENGFDIMRLGLRDGGLVQIKFKC